MSSPPSFLVQVIHRQIGGRGVGHVVAFVAAPPPGRNTFSLVHGPNAVWEAKQFPSIPAAEAAVDSLPESPTRLSYEIVPRANFLQAHT